MRIYCALLFLLSTTNLFGQNYYGPKLTAMGNNNTSVSDIWSVHANPTGLAHFLKPAVAIHYQKFLFNPELSQQAVALVFPIDKNIIGFGIQRYGFSAYQDLKTALSFSKRFGDKLSLGVTLNYYQLKIINYGNAKNLTADIGIRYQINKQFLVAGYFANLHDQQQNNIQSNTSSHMNLGFNYSPSNKVDLAFSMGKMQQQPIHFSLGLDYKVISSFSLRGGLSSLPLRQFGGFGINYKDFKFEFATSYHSRLGYSPQMGLSYDL